MIRGATWGAGDLAGQNHPVEPSLSSEVPGLRGHFSTRQNQWSGPWEAAPGGGAAKLDNTGLFYV